MFRTLRCFRISLAESLIGVTLAALSCAALVNASRVIALIVSGAFVLVVAVAVAVNWRSKHHPFCAALLLVALFHQLACNGQGASSQLPYNEPSTFPTIPLLESLWIQVRIETPDDPSFDPRSFDPPGGGGAMGGGGFFAVEDNVQFGGGGGSGGLVVYYRPAKDDFMNVGVPLASLWLGLLAGLLSRAIARANENPPPARGETVAA